MSLSGYLAVGDRIWARPSESYRFEGVTTRFALGLCSIAQRDLGRPVRGTLKAWAVPSRHAPRQAAPKGAKGPSNVCESPSSDQSQTAVTANSALSAVDNALTDIRSLRNRDQHALLSPEQRAGLLAKLRTLVDATEAAFLDCLDHFDSHGDCETLGASRTTRAWLRKELKLAPGDAGERVRIARGAHLYDTLEELRKGTVTYDQARAIEHATRTVPEDQRIAAAETLTALAIETDVVDVRVAGHKLACVVNPDGALQTADRQFERRHLTLSPLLDGMTHLDGLLDPESATLVSTALAPFLIPTDKDDRRTSSQRRADGLVSIVGSALKTGDVPQQSGAPTQLQVLVPLQALSGGRDEANMLPNEVAKFADSASTTPYLTPEVLNRISCDATVTRIVLSPDSMPLDVGRSKRLFTPAQQLALAIRDGGCRFPGCDLPPRYTDAHHIVPWQRGGATDLGNGLLLCRHHHRRVHEGGWSISDFDLGSASATFVSPYGLELSGEARGP